MRRSALLLPLLSGLLIAGCAGQSDRKADDTFRVVTTFLPVQRLAVELLHDLQGVEVLMVASSEAGCPHHYTLSPGDAHRLSRADLLVRLGSGIDDFISPTHLAEFAPDVRIITLESDETNHTRTQDHPVGDEPHSHNHQRSPQHAWVSPLRLQELTKRLADSLSLALPQYGDSIRTRSRQLADELTRIGAEMRLVTEQSGTRHIIAMHTSFNQLAEDIGLEVVTVVQPDVSVPPGPRVHESIRQKARQTEIAFVVSEPQVNPVLAAAVAREAQAPLIELDSGVTGSSEPGSLLAMQHTNLRILQEIFRGRP